ncbi:hypothetical protein LPJ75_002948 [Coemansia sp. RSA 2598]|nr:hypothetical protein LPJ75_002948 [Coemansia sp. RSA 2598]
MASLASKSAKNSNSSHNGKQRRKKKSRADKLAAAEQRNSKLAGLISSAEWPEELENVTVEYVEQPQPDIENPAFAQFSEVFSHFAKNAAKSFGADDGSEQEGVAGDAAQKKMAESVVEPTRMDDDSDVDMNSISRDESESSDMESGDDDGGEGKAGGNRLSRKQRKKTRITIAELKQLAPRPEVVEWTDTSAQDPKLLVTLKGLRNTVPVPIHWGQKKKYLQYKRGMEKPPFELPDFIKATGIMEMREAIQDKEEENKAKTTARERMRPKMNKLTLDYQRLHDAFFRFQTPPKHLTSHGDLFYEGKENDSTFNFTPGVLSDSLRAALSIPPLAPPPWLLNMQRYGPPPSYPNMVIPGLNAPIPPGAQWGFHPGGWGRPPVDEFGRPLYGDVFAASAHDPNVAASLLPEGGAQPLAAAPTGPKKYWGDLEAESSDEEDDDDEEEGSGSSDEEMQSEPGIEAGKDSADARKRDKRGAHANATQLTDDQLRSGIASIPSGLETPSVIQLRKQAAVDESAERRSLYTVLPEQATAKLEGIMGSQFTYDMSSALDPSKGGAAAAASGKKAKPIGKGVDIALDASELEGLDEEALKAKYEEAAYGASIGTAGAHNHEDLSDMVAEHAATQARKRKPNASSSGAGNASSRKKAKDFKF